MNLEHNSRLEPVNLNGAEPKIVVIGGGSGTSNILRGLKGYPVDLSAIVTMFDSGGSSGLLRTEFGYPPFGDLRQCLLALGDDDPQTRIIHEALAFRFGDETSLNGHSVGNLLMAALTSLTGDVERAIRDISRVLGVTGNVIPVTLDRAELCAELEDGRTLYGESQIDLRWAATPRIRKIFLDAEVEANSNAIRAVEAADIVVLGPGDLYTSVLPNLLPKGMVEAIGSCRATRVFICNLMTKRGETDGYDASAFVREVRHYLGGDALDWNLVNTGKPTTAVLEAYAEEGAQVVEPTLDKIGEPAMRSLTGPLASDSLPLLHDADRTAAAIFQVWRAGRASRSDVMPTPVASPSLTSAPPDDESP